jgi:rhomboid protease GluP
LTNGAAGSGGGEEPILITPDMLASRAPAPATPGRDRAGRIDFERGMRRLPPVIFLIIAANIAVFVWEVASGAFLASKESIEAGVSGATLIDTGALERARVLAGEWWRMGTALFLHGGFGHLFGNMVALYIVGMACEHAFGAVRMGLIYFGAGLAGSVLSLLASPGPSVGASGAVFGVLAAVVVTLYRHRHRFFIRDARIGVVLGAWAGWQLLTGFLTPYVDNFAHVGGMIGGAAAALLATPRLTATGGRR